MAKGQWNWGFILAMLANAGLWAAIVALVRCALRMLS